MTEKCQFLKSNDTKALIYYLEDVFGKMNGLKRNSSRAKDFDGQHDQNLCFHHETDLLALTDCET